MERKLEELEGRSASWKNAANRLELEFQQERRAKLRELDSRLESTLRRTRRRGSSRWRSYAGKPHPPRSCTRGERKASSLVREAREEWNTQVLEALGEPAPAATRAPVVTAMAVGDRVQADECFNARHCHGAARRTVRWKLQWGY